MSTILIVVLVLLLVGVLPTWPHSANWGYGPSGDWASSSWWSQSRANLSLSGIPWNREKYREYLR